MAWTFYNSSGEALVNFGPVSIADGGSRLVLIGTAVASGSADLTIPGLDSTYDTYLIAISDINPATDNQTLGLRVGHSGAVDSDSTDYSYHQQKLSEGTAVYAADVSAGDDRIVLTDGIGNLAVEGVGGVLWLHRPGNGTTEPVISGHVSYVSNLGILKGGLTIGRRAAVITLDRIQILMSSGAMDTGRLTVWGVAHA